MKRCVLLCLVLAGLPPLAAAPVAGTVTVAAASNLTSVGPALRSAFRGAHPQADVAFVYGASGALATQIQNGAPFQLFLSADTELPRLLADHGFAAGPPFVYARGSVVLLSTTPLDFRGGLAALLSPGVTRVAIANPELAPYGRAARDALRRAGLWERVQTKLVTAQSLAQALQLTLTATGVGFVGRSALATPELAAYADKRGVNWLELEPSPSAPLDQAFVLLRSAADDPVALAFAAFLRSSAARAVFEQAGYAVP